MRKLNWIAVALLIGLFTVVVHGASSTTKRSSTTRPSGRLFAPYSKMTSLSDDQKEQIEVIHRKVLAQEKEIEAKEKEDILALLSDDQKKEIHDIEDKTSSDRKAKASSK
ncbi:MAG TPA: hypothetical protein VHS31_02325 [Tepidisphaeraceae bacterium]|jgi:hypothetical protein|nr:hypothetical protein [Tepidisphaeraceae bacterium]